MVNITRVIAAATLAALCLTGCGTSSTSDTSLTPMKSPSPLGEQTVTFRVNEMGERLELLCPG